MSLKSFIIPALAIIAITTLALVALLNGINGALFMSAITIIGGIAGYEIGRRIKKSS